MWTSRTNALSGVCQNEISNKPPFAAGTLLTRYAITVGTYDLQSDGKLSIIVVGKDAAGGLVN
jgi:hypothetical protein